MQILHSSGCKSPPAGCDRGYLCLAFIIGLSSFIEGFIGWYFAASNAIRADAAHAALHSGIYLSAAYVGWLVRKRNFSVEEERGRRILYCKRNIASMFILGLSPPLLSAFWRLTHPVSVSGGYMAVGALVGIVGTASALFILRIMAKDHVVYAQDEIECRGSEEMHETMSWDTTSDLSISVVALLVAILALLVLPISGFLHYIDTFLTIATISWIVFKSKKLWSSLNTGGRHHHH